MITVTRFDADGHVMASSSGISTPTPTGLATTWAYPVGASPPGLSGRTRLAVYYPSVLEIGAASDAAAESPFPTSRAEYTTNKSARDSRCSSVSASLSRAESCAGGSSVDEAAAAPTTAPQRPSGGCGVDAYGFSLKELRRIKLAKRFFYAAGSERRISLSCPHCNTMNAGLDCAFLEAMREVFACTSCARVVTHSPDRFQAVQALLAGASAGGAEVSVTKQRSLAGGSKLAKLLALGERLLK